MHYTQLSTILSINAPFLTLLFLMQSRNVDPQKPVQPFPAALQPVLERLQHVPDMPQVRLLLLTTAAQHPHMQPVSWVCNNCLQLPICIKRAY